MFKHLEGLEKKRLQGLREQGKLKIRDEDEMLKILKKVNQIATLTLHAVDRTPIGFWTANENLQTYLDDQLKQVGERGVALERIYLVDQSVLQDEEKRDLLVDFVHRHDEALATLLLCPVEVASGIGSVFSGEDWGLILADSEKTPLAVTGKLKVGEVGSAFLYTREQADIEEFQRQYKTLRELVRVDGHDHRLRGELGLK